MRREMLQLHVETTTSGEIEIGQAGVGPEEDHIVRINPDQVPVLIKWLQQASEELEAPKDAG